MQNCRSPGSGILYKTGKTWSLLKVVKAVEAVKVVETCSRL